jgi:hypothetical protein
MRWLGGLLIQLSILFFFLVSCEKGSETPGNCIPINFISLEAENDTIESGSDTDIRAEAEGEGLKYEWTKSLGIIEGSGAQVTYIATPCAIGEIEVTCRVIDKCNNSESMTIKIYVI